MYSSRRSFCDTSRIATPRSPIRSAGLTWLAGIAVTTGIGPAEVMADPVAHAVASGAGGICAAESLGRARRAGRPGQLVGQRRVVRLDRVELVVDPRAQPVAAQQPDRALGREDPR